MTASSQASEHELVREVVDSYLALHVPDRREELDHVFQAVFQAAVSWWERAMHQASPDRADGHLSTSDRSNTWVLEGTHLLAATSIALTLCRGNRDAVSAERTLQLLDTTFGKSSIAERIQVIYRQKVASSSADTERESSPTAVGSAAGTPDLIVLASEERHQGSIRLSYDLKAASSSLGLNFSRFGPIPLRTDPQSYFEALFRDIERFSRTDADAHTSRRRLKRIATDLTRRILPLELQEVLWSIREEVRSIVVTSWEPWIPWEFLTLQDPGGSSNPEFLGEAFEITRWVPGVQEALELSVSSIGLIASSPSELGAAQDEAEFVRSLGSPLCQVTSIPCRYLEVTDALDRGAHDTWHFCGHGVARGTEPGRWRILLGDEDELEARELSGIGPAFGKRRPLVFLNACQTGRGGYSITGMGGFAHALVNAGAGAFIGTHWSVPDDLAFRFAQTFYESFLGGDPLGKAARVARLALRDAAPGEPAGLAYTVFGHPLARSRS